MRVPAGEARLAMSPEDAADIRRLPTAPVEWVIDVGRQGPGTAGSTGASSSLGPLVCVIAEQSVGRGAKPGAGAGDAVAIHQATIREGDDEALVTLNALLEAVLAGEEPLPRPQRLVFRQPRLASLLHETLEDAGLEVAVRTGSSGPPGR